MDSKTLWPGWETVRLIGRGSFGAVYEIERDVFGHKEKAALKHISIPQSDSDIEELYDSGYDEQSVTATFKSHLQSIVNEYSLMREMNGAANVVNCDDFRIVPHDDNIGWDIFIKMELLTPLTKALGRQPDEAQVIRIAKDMCGALILCKKHGIIHRDIKPQNIFVSKNGDYKLGDFGIAKTIEKTSGGTKIGTYKYMAPEVFNNRPYNLTADIYSLGLVLYWMLNERRSPFMPLPPAPAVAQQEDEARARRFAGEPLPPPAHGGEALKKIVLKACAFDPKDRWQSAEDMLRALDSLSASSAPAKNAADDEGTTIGVFKPAAPVPPAPAPVSPVPAGAGVPDGPSPDDGDGTIGVFGRKIDKTPAPASAGADAPDGPSVDDEGTTIGVFNPAAPVPRAPTPTPEEDATVPVATKTSHAQKAAPAEAPKKKFPIWIPIVGVLAVAAILLLIVLPNRNSHSQPSEAARRETQPLPAAEATAAGSKDSDLDDSKDVLTHDEYMALPEGSPVTVEAYVQGVQTWWNGGVSVYAQDENGGYYFYSMACSEADAEKLVPGTKIKVKGEKAAWAGQVEIINGSFEFMDGSWIANPLDIEPFVGKAELESHMSERISVSGATVADMGGSAVFYNWDNSGEDGSDLYFDIELNGVTVHCVVRRVLIASDSEVYETVKNLKIGDTVGMEGFLYWYDGPQLQITKCNVISITRDVVPLIGPVVEGKYNLLFAVEAKGNLNSFTAFDWQRYDEKTASWKSIAFSDDIMYNPQFGLRQENQFEASEGKYRSMLWATGITIDAAGTYRCVITDENGFSKTSSEATVSIELLRGSGPVITKFPADMFIKQGEDVAFVALADKADTVEWFFLNADGTQEIKAKDIGQYIPGVYAEGYQEETMVVYNIPCEMDGWKVRAKFTGAEGVSTTKCATITLAE